MGFVLASVSEKSASDYNLYIVFRGSRSGKLRHHQAGWTQVGNPDWVTDWQVLYLEGDPEISQYGQCSKGFAASIKSIFPTIIRCWKRSLGKSRPGPARSTSPGIASVPPWPANLRVPYYGVPGTVFGETICRPRCEHGHGVG